MSEVFTYIAASLAVLFGIILIIVIVHRINRASELRDWREADRRAREILGMRKP